MTYDGGLHEPPRVANRIKEGKRFLHAIDALVLIQHLIVLAQGDQEDQRSDVLEAVNPLLSLRALTANIEETVGELTDAEGSLRNTGRLDTRAENVLVSGQIAGVGHAVNGIEVAVTAASLVILKHRALAE